MVIDQGIGGIEQSRWHPQYGISASNPTPPLNEDGPEAEGSLEPLRAIRNQILSLVPTGVVDHASQLLESLVALASNTRPPPQTSPEEVPKAVRDHITQAVETAVTTALQNTLLNVPKQSWASVAAQPAQAHSRVQPGHKPILPQYKRELLVNTRHSPLELANCTP